jgi:hypothetical protein
MSTLKVALCGLMFPLARPVTLQLAARSNISVKNDDYVHELALTKGSRS